MHFRLRSHGSMMMSMGFDTLWAERLDAGDRSAEVGVWHTIVLLTEVFTIDCWVLGGSDIGIFAILHVFESL